MINNKSPLIIIGASGFGKEVAKLAEECGIEILGFLDDDEQKVNNTYLGYNVIGAIDSAINFNDCEFVIAIGDPRIRKSISEKLKDININRFKTIAHPNVSIHKSVHLGHGSIICEGTILTVDISVGNHCHINLANTIGHDTIIHDFCTIAPQAILSGNVVLEAGVEVGTGAAIRQGLILKTGSLLGMGSVATKNIDANMIYFGNPSKAFKSLEKFIC